MLTQLNLDHLDLYLDFKKHAPPTWKLSSFSDHSTQPVIDYYTDILCKEKNYTIGWIENNKLLAVSCLFHVNPRVWVWEYFSTVAQNYFSNSLECKFTVINDMFEEALHRKYGTCVFLCRDNFPSITSDAKGKMKLAIASWHDKVPEIKKYHWLDEYRIPANTTPTDKNIFFLMGSRTHPINLRVRVGYLKQEYRDDEFLKLY
jgi:hypothetical protein